VRNPAVAAFVAAAIAGAGLRADAVRQDAAAAIAADAAHIAGARGRIPAEYRAKFDAALAAIDAERKAGRTWVALERLRDARRLAALGGTGEPPGSFDVEWKRESGELRRRDESLPGWGDAPAAARALGEAAEGTVVPLVDASRAFAEVTNAESGRYYLADARVASAFGAFCRALSAPKSAPPPWRSIAPELARLQARVDAAFVPPRSIERHSDFIRLNATVKTARELDAAGRFAGAGYEYLDSLQQLGTLLGDAEAPAATVRGKLEAERSALSSGDRDDSLGLLFVERAESSSARGDNAAASEIASTVVPAYQAMLEPASAPPAADAAVTITLVRWPYT